MANTLFGYTIVGKVNSESQETIIFNLILVNETENFGLQCFWNLESLGIYDSKSEIFSRKDLDTHNFVNDNLNFINNRYETKLL